jgi:hypothetical protein
MTQDELKELERQRAEIDAFLFKTPEQIAEDKAWEKRELRNLFKNALTEKS